MADPLPSWNDGANKQAILDFVAGVTDETSPGYVPSAERVATFDNDGTLWVEKPTYIQLLFTIERMKQMANEDSNLADQPAHKAAAEGDLTYFGKLFAEHPRDLIGILIKTHAGMAQPEFEKLALDFLSDSNHPRFEVPFKQCIYRPMVELLQYLRHHDFKVFITSAGGMSFMRTVSEEIYGVARENVIGSNVTFEFVDGDAGPQIHRTAGILDPIDDGPGKPINIELHIGRRPILAGGNANGDIEMCKYAQGDAKRPWLCLLVHHDDAEREYEYEGTREDKVFGLAKERGWHTISMKNDWKTIFNFQ